MTVLQEGNIQITFPENSNPRKFDDNHHRLSHCMKAVDFIPELDDRYIFIEIKDPQHPKADSKNVFEFIEKLKSHNILNDLKTKYRDSFLYEFGLGRANKDNYYYVLIALDSLTPNLLRHQSEELQKRIPIKGLKGISWSKPFVKDCAIFNIETWNHYLSQFPINRI